MDKPVVRISVRNLVEFILRSGILTTGEDLLTEKQCRRAADCTEKYRAGWEAITERRFLLNIKQNMKM